MQLIAFSNWMVMIAKTFVFQSLWLNWRGREKGWNSMHKWHICICLPFLLPPTPQCHISKCQTDCFTMEKKCFYPSLETLYLTGFRVQIFYTAGIVHIFCTLYVSPLILSKCAQHILFTMIVWLQMLETEHFKMESWQTVSTKRGGGL